MSDWMVIPEIENALIVFVEFTEGDLEAKPRVVEHLREAAAAPGVTPYIFYSPPEMGEEIHEELSEFEERFAFAAQMPGKLGERMKFAFRRVFSRNSVKKAVLVGPGSLVSRDKIAAAFAALDGGDIVLGSMGDDAFSLLGLRTLQTGLLEEIEWESPGSISGVLEKIGSDGLRGEVV